MHFGGTNEICEIQQSADQTGGPSPSYEENFTARVLPFQNITWSLLPRGTAVCARTRAPTRNLGPAVWFKVVTHLILHAKTNINP